MALVSGRWQLQFARVETVTAPTSVRTAVDPLGIVVHPAMGRHQMECELPA